MSPRLTLPEDLHSERMIIKTPTDLEQALVQRFGLIELLDLCDGLLPRPNLLRSVFGAFALTLFWDLPSEWLLVEN
jgi:hypothetical protein